MAQSVIFEGRNIRIPGAYSTVKFNLQNSPIRFSYGGLTIIDTGQSYDFGFGSGVNGELEQGKKSIYSFRSIEDFQSAVGGGIYWLLAEYLFFPVGRKSGGINGVSYIEYIRASTSKSAVAEFSPTGGGGNGGTIKLKTNVEGKAGNGVDYSEQPATGTVKIDDVGNTGDTITVQSLSPVTGALKVTLGTYTKDPAQTTSDEIAVEITKSINDNSANTGFTATVATNIITVSMIKGEGTNGDNYVLSVETSAIDVTIISFTGGVDGSGLDKGFAFTLEAGEINEDKFIFKAWRGTYKGDDSLINLDQTEPLDFIDPALTTPNLLAESIEVSNVKELTNWMNDNIAFKFWFTVVSSTSNQIGAIDNDDLSKYSSYTKFTSGIDSFSSKDLITAIEAIKSSKSSFILCGEFGEKATSVNNFLIEGYAKGNPSDKASAKYKKQMYVAAGSISDDFKPSLLVAEQYNTDVTSVIFGGVKKFKADGTYKKYKSIVQAASLLGREAGIEPQNPLTFKNIDIDGLILDLSEKQKEIAISGGILTVVYDEDFEDFVCLSGINSLQDNSILINKNSKSYSKQLNRVINQINKELPIRAKIALFGKESGTNKNNVTQADVESFTKGFLQSQTAVDTEDNLILSFQNVNVREEGISYRITYEVLPNYEVNYMLFTGTVIDPTL